MVLRIEQNQTVHPDIQRKAQDEVDGVVGNRLPVLADRKSLPFTGYIIKECLRICAVVPLMPHSLDRDDASLFFHVSFLQFTTGQ
jgi:cytochrome P450